MVDIRVRSSVTIFNFSSWKTKIQLREKYSAECCGGGRACFLPISWLPEVSPDEHEDQLNNEEDGDPSYESGDVEANLDVAGIKDLVRKG